MRDSVVIWCSWKVFKYFGFFINFGFCSIRIIVRPAGRCHLGLEVWYVLTSKALVMVILLVIFRTIWPLLLLSCRIICKLDIFYYLYCALRSRICSHIPSLNRKYGTDSGSELRYSLLFLYLLLMSAEIRRYEPWLTFYDYFTTRSVWQGFELMDFIHFWDRVLYMLRTFWDLFGANPGARFSIFFAFRSVLQGFGSIDFFSHIVN